MRRFFQNDRGTGAIEFGLIGSALSLVALGIGSGWSYMQQENNMRDGVEAAAKYYIMGGSSDTTAQNIANAAWSSKPSGGNVTVVRCQICPNQSGCVVSLNCLDTSVPQIHLTITATSTWNDPFHSVFADSVSMVQTQVVRVR